MGRSKPRAPESLTAYRLDAEDELVLFVWQPEARAADLSPAERAVLALVAEGRSNAEIAKARGTGLRTVANQVASLLRKLGAQSRYELIGRAVPRRR